MSHDEYLFRGKDFREALIHCLCILMALSCYIYVTRFAKTRHNDAFLEFQIFALVSFMYLKLCSVAISMLYC